MAQLLEHKQHDPVDQVHKRRRADVGGVRLRQHYLLDGTTVVVKDEGEQAQYNDDADYEPFQSQLWRPTDRVSGQENIDIGQVLYQPLAPEETSRAPLGHNPPRTRRPFHPVETRLEARVINLYTIMATTKAVAYPSNDLSNMLDSAFGAKIVSVRKVVLTGTPQRVSKSRRRRDAVNPAKVIRHRDCLKPTVGNIPTMCHPPIHEDHRYNAAGKEPEYPPRTVGIGTEKGSQSLNRIVADDRIRAEHEPERAEHEPERSLVLPDSLSILLGSFR